MAGVLLSIGVCLSATAALAYVLPGGAILRRLVNMRNDLRLTSLKVDGTLSFYGDAVRDASQALSLPGDRPETQADAAIFLRLPGRCRLEVTTAEGNRISVVEAGGRHGNEGASVESLNAALHTVCVLLAVRGSSEQDTRAELDRTLRGIGIEPKVTGLGRMGDGIAYVLGRAGEGQPQFWVFKDSFQPARLRYSDAQKAAWDIRFLDYSSPFAGDLFPRVIEVSRNGDRLLRFTVLRADTKTPLQDRLFSAQ